MFKQLFLVSGEPSATHENPFPNSFPTFKNERGFVFRGDLRGSFVRVRGNAHPAIVDAGFRGFHASVAVRSTGRAFSERIGIGDEVQNPQRIRI